MNNATRVRSDGLKRKLYKIKIENGRIHLLTMIVKSFNIPFRIGINKIIVIKRIESTVKTIIHK